jgi:hypothetical protein
MSLSLELPFPYKVLILKKGSDMIARTRNGKIISTSATDGSIVLNAAITSMTDSTEGASIYIGSGIYPCLTEVVATDTAANNQGVSIIGESKDECKLNFTPGSALTNAIRFKMHHVQFRGIHVAANTNVTNLIRIDGNGQHGIIDSCQITGATATPTAGQLGILNDATTAAATYYWRFTNNQFNSLDTCGKFTAGTNPSNANFFDNNNYINFNIGLDILSNMHMITNQFFQGTASLGDACIKLNGSGCFNCGLFNIKADTLSKAGSAVVELTSGATNNHGAAITNTGTGAIIEDASGLTTNSFLPTYEDKTNTFTQKQTIQRNVSEMLDLYGTTNSNGSTVDLSYYHNSSTSVKRRLSAITSELIDNTNTSEDSALNLWVNLNGSFLKVLRITNDGSLELTKVSVPADPTAELGRLYFKQIDANNNGLFVKLKQAGSIVEVQIAP